MKIARLEDLPEVTTSHSGAGKKKVLVADGLVPNLQQFGRVTFQPGEIAKEHSHDKFSEIMYVESGSGIIKINGEKNEIKKGDCITVEVGELHEIINDGQEPITLLFFGVFK